jgi:hypothetical protein
VSEGVDGGEDEGAVLEGERGGGGSEGGWWRGQERYGSYDWVQRLAEAVKEGEEAASGCESGFLGDVDAVCAG